MPTSRYVRLRYAVVVGAYTAMSTAVQVAGAQQQPMTLAAALDGRLDRPTRHAVEAILDSAAQSDLPVAPLVDKALEGSAKRASGARIVDAVRTLASDLHTVRDALGNTVDEPALTAGVGALRAGVLPAQLRELRDARNGGGVTWPLTVLTDLVTRGVPADTAVDVIAGLSRAGATDAAFRRFAADVLRDIAAGVPPGAAAVARAGIELPPNAMRHGPPPTPAMHAPATPRAPAHPTPPHRRPTR